MSHHIVKSVANHSIPEACVSPPSSQANPAVSRYEYRLFASDHSDNFSDTINTAFGQRWEFVRDVSRSVGLGFILRRPVDATTQPATKPPAAPPALTAASSGAAAEAQNATPSSEDDSVDISDIVRALPLKVNCPDKISNTYEVLTYAKHLLRVVQEWLGPDQGHMAEPILLGLAEIIRRWNEPRVTEAIIAELRVLSVGPSTQVNQAAALALSALTRSAA